MPDPADPDFLAELDNFSAPGLTMNPLPADEVRRRGTRIRRRNNALATIGAVAAVAIIATPIALAAGGGNPGRPTPAPATEPPGGWTTVIPEDFDLTDGWNPELRAGPQDRPINDDICATPLEGDGVDRLGVGYAEPGTESSGNRTLTVYADQAAATAQVDQIRTAVQDCDDAEVRSSDLGTEESLVFTARVLQEDGTPAGGSVYQVGRTGNAVFVEQVNGWPGDEGSAPGEVDRVRDQADGVVDQMCAFSIEGCEPADPDASEAVDEPTGLSGTIPDDFPLEKGLPTDQSGGAVGLEAPTRDLDLAPYAPDSIEACGVTPTGLPEPVDTLYAGYRSPAYGVLRQLMTFASVDEAQSYAEGLLAPYSTCPEETDNRGVAALHEVQPADLGDHAATAYQRHEVDGEPGPGYQLVQVVRVGQAVLQTLVNNDGEMFDPDASATYLESSQTVVDEMS
ncbi:MULTISPECIES: hypothetical protein [unclassified Nocardioides]|uniref:hypothetical protein n=1 Tax=unclassified Nocardioides TaxID=2615069 RepID=UPI00361B2BF6